MRNCFVFYLKTIFHNSDKNAYKLEWRGESALMILNYKPKNCNSWFQIHELKLWPTYHTHYEKPNRFIVYSQ